MTDVTWMRPEYGRSLSTWRLLDDACSSGDGAVKKARTLYLPMPNPSDESQENKDRYEQYLSRAVFYNVAGRTLSGLTGMAFKQEPELLLPQGLDYLGDDVDGAGVSLKQQAQKVVSQVLKLGRHALYVDYPETSGEVSVAQRQVGGLRARVVSVNAGQVINWRTEQVAGQTRLVLVVIRESHEITNGFSLEIKERFRVLTLENDVYRVRVFNDDNLTTPVQDRIPTDGNGVTWEHIPLVFVGATNNDVEIDEPPMLDIANLNMAHYRNSADYEDSVYFVGQAQPWISGIDDEWRDYLEGRGLYVGSRSPMLLPEGGAFGFAQPQPNTLVKEAMEAKEQQMMALGARLMERGSAVKTATQVDSEDGVAHSVLSLVAQNVSDAYLAVLGWCARYENASDAIEFSINQDYMARRADPQTIAAIVAAWQQGAIPKSQLWRNLRRVDVIDQELKDEDIKDELEIEDHQADDVTVE